MHIHLIKERTLRNFAYENAQSFIPIEEWLGKIKKADWETPEDIKRTFSSSDLIGRSSHSAIFNLGGNHYRMICKYVFGEHEVHLFVCWMGTHSEYDKLCEKSEQYSINLF